MTHVYYIYASDICDILDDFGVQCFYELTNAQIKSAAKARPHAIEKLTLAEFEAFFNEGFMGDNVGDYIRIIGGEDE